MHLAKFTFADYLAQTQRTDRRTDGQRQADRQTDRQTDREIGRHTQTGRSK